MKHSEKDFLSILPRPASTRGHKTHEVENMPPEMPDQNLYLGDEVLKGIVKRADIEWIHDKAIQTGAITGSRQYRDIARIANSEKPKLWPIRS